MNGIGGSATSRQRVGAAISSATKSMAKGDHFEHIVPMVPHCDHNEHDVDVVVTEQGLADLRGLARRGERATRLSTIA